MRTVWKILLDPLEPSPQTHQLPFGAKAIHVDRDTRDPDKVAVWFECNPEADQCGIPLWLVGTGDEIPGTTQHIGSAVISILGLHVYMGHR